MSRLFLEMSPISWALFQTKKALIFLSSLSIAVTP